MTGVVEAAVVKALEATITAAAKNAGKRLWAEINPFAARNKKKATSLANLIRSMDFTDRVSLLGVFDDLPHGVTLARVERVLSSLPVQSVVHELVSTHLGLANESRKKLVSDNFKLVMAQELGGAPQDQADILAEKIFVRLDSAIQQVLSEYESVDSAGFAQMQVLASASLVDATLQAVERHNSMLDRFKDAPSVRALEGWIHDYRHQVTTAHGFIAPPDFERKRKVPMDSLYVAPTIRHINQRHGGPDEIDIAEFSSSIDRTVLLGDPGGGKSTAASYIAYAASKDIDARVPFLVILREFAREDDLDRSVVKYLEERCDTFYQCKPPEGAIEHLLLNGQALIIFDGLDELIDTSKRRQVTEVVELFSARFPLTSALVTSRRVGYEQAQLDPKVFGSYVLGGFGKKDVERYVQKWFSAVEELDGDDLDEACKSFVEESSTVPDLTATPLMLALMCIIYRGQGFIPKNRPAVYESCALLLFEKWDSSRKIFVGLRAADQVDAAIKHLAFWMLTNEAGAEAVAESDLIREAADFLETSFEDPRERRRAAEEFVAFCRGRAWVLSDAGTTPEGEALFKFTHRTFMEYFAAYELTRRADGPAELAKALLPRIAKAEWDVVGQLAVQISNKHSREGASRIFTVFLSDRRRRNDRSRDNIHAFIWRCLSFLPISPPLLRRLVEASLESSFRLRLRPRYYSGDDIPSIVHALDILPDSRGIVSEALISGLLAMIEGKEPDRVAFAKIALLSWSAAAHITETRNPRAEWLEWADEQVTVHKQVLLADGPGDRDAWLVALTRGYVSMSEYLDNSAKWGGAMLDSLFTSQVEAPLAFALTDWASTAVLRPRRLKGEEGGRLYARQIEDLSQLGARIAPNMDQPLLDWSNVPTPYRSFFHRDWNRDFSAFTDNDDVNWAMWILFACRFETMENNYFHTRRQRELAGAADFAEEVFQLRTSGGQVPDDLYKDTMFENLTGARREVRDAWTSGKLNVVSHRTKAG